MGATAASGLALVPSALAAESSSAKTAVASPGGEALKLENEHFSLTLDGKSGALWSLFVKRNKSELIGEKRLAANFRICLPLPDYLCNYIDGMAQQPTSVEQTADAFQVTFSGLKSEKGVFPLNLSYTIKLSGDEGAISCALDEQKQISGVRVLVSAAGRVDQLQRARRPHGRSRLQVVPA